MKFINLFSIIMLMGASALAKQPNIVFIVVDDLGWKDTGCYGSTFYETPNVDRLAATGMRFTDAYSANPLCSPTRASILTGQYPARTGFTGASGHIAGDRKHEESTKSNADVRAAGPKSINHLLLDYYTMGEAFKDAGYQTAFLGKWHMGHAPYIPENHGFDYVIGGRHHPGPPGTVASRKFYPPWSGDTLQPNPKEDIHIDDYLGNKAVEYIADNKDKPFLMCFWLYDVHMPLQSKPELIEKWKKKVDPKNAQHGPTMAAMIEVMDDNVGRVLDALEANGLSEDTIVIFTSDNGGNMYDVWEDTTPTNNEPLRSGKGNNYEGGVRVPLIVRWPGKTKPGTVNSSVISTVDHYPSLLEMTGQKLRPDDHKDGVSYVPALNGEAFDRGPTLCDFTHFVRATMNVPNTWLRMGDWKLLKFWFDGPNQTHRYELYNLKDDIGESNNLASQYPEKVQTMSAKIDAYYTSTGSLKTNANKAYNGRTVGVWTPFGKGKASAVDGALDLQAEQKGFNAKTRITPSLINGAILEFEARSTKGESMTLEWTSSRSKKFGKPEYSASQVLSNDWKKYRMNMSFTGRILELRFVLPEAGDHVSFRRVNLQTLDGSVITEYKFY